MTKKRSWILIGAAVVILAAGLAIWAVATGADRDLKQAQAAVQSYADAVVAKDYATAYDLAFGEDTGGFLGKASFQASFAEASADLDHYDLHVFHSPTGGDVSEQTDGEENTPSVFDGYGISVVFYSAQGQVLANDSISFDVVRQSAGSWQLRPVSGTVKNISIHAPPGAAVTVDGITVRETVDDKDSRARIAVIPEIHMGAHAVQVEAPGYLDYSGTYNFLHGDQEIIPVYHASHETLLQMEQIIQAALTGILERMTGEPIAADVLALFTEPSVAEAFAGHFFDETGLHTYYHPVIEDFSVLPEIDDHSPGEYLMEALLTLTHETDDGQGTYETESERLYFHIGLVHEGDDWLIDELLQVYG